MLGHPPAGDPAAALFLSWSASASSARGRRAWASPRGSLASLSSMTSAGRPWNAVCGAASQTGGGDRLAGDAALRPGGLRRRSALPRRGRRGPAIAGSPSCHTRCVSGRTDSPRFCGDSTSRHQAGRGTVLRFLRMRFCASADGGRPSFAETQVTSREELFRHESTRLPRPRREPGTPSGPGDRGQTDAIVQDRHRPRSAGPTFTSSKATSRGRARDGARARGGRHGRQTGKAVTTLQAGDRFSCRASLVRPLPVLPRGPLRPVHRRRRLDPRSPDRRPAGRARTRAVRRHLRAQARPESSDEQALFLADILPTAYEVGVLNGRSNRATRSPSSEPARSGWQR